MRLLVVFAAAAALVAACRSQDSETQTPPTTESSRPAEPEGSERLPPSGGPADEPTALDDPDPAPEEPAAPPAEPPAVAADEPTTTKPPATAAKPAANKPPASDGEIAAARTEAKTLFRERCITCHGPKGDGKGAASASLNPKPRNWTDAAWQSETSDAEIEKVILKGGPSVGLSPLMPGNVDLEDKPAVLRELRKIVRGFGK